MIRFIISSPIRHSGLTEKTWEKSRRKENLRGQKRFMDRTGRKKEKEKKDSHRRSSTPPENE